MPIDNPKAAAGLKSRIHCARQARTIRDIVKVPVVCLAHVTNRMAQVEGDFEKGDADGSKGPTGKTHKDSA